jgi:branched-chain amino acid transport system substrate-binding protein
MKSGKYIMLFMGVVVIFTIGFMLAVCATAAEKGPIKVGIPYPLTGAQASQGIQMKHAATLLFEEKGMKVGNRKIELIFEDDETKADIALTKTKKLVEFDKVHLISGYLSAATGYAVRDYLHDNKKIPTLVCGAGAKHSREVFTPWIFRVTPSTFQYTYEPSKWWYQNGYKGKTYKKVVFVGADYASPREVIVAFKKGFEGVGGKVIQELWPPLGCPDYGPYLSAVKADEADAMVVAMWAGDATRIVKQWVEYGLNKRMPIIGVASFTDEGTALPGMGVSADGILSWYISTPQADLPENKKFVEAFKKRTGSLPGQYAYLAYISAQAAYETLNKVKGDVENKEKLREAMQKLEFTTPMGGKAFFDSKNAMVYDMIFLEARKTNGECHIFEIGRIKNVKEPYEVFP